MPTRSAYLQYSASLSNTSTRIRKLSGLAQDLGDIAGAVWLADVGRYLADLAKNAADQSATGSAKQGRPSRPQTITKHGQET